MTDVIIKIRVNMGTDCHTSIGIVSRSVRIWTMCVMGTDEEQNELNMQEEEPE